MLRVLVTRLAPRSDVKAHDTDDNTENENVTHERRLEGLATDLQRLLLAVYTRGPRGGAKLIYCVAEKSHRSALSFWCNENRSPGTSSFLFIRDTTNCHWYTCGNDFIFGLKQALGVYTNDWGGLGNLELHVYTFVGNL